MGFLGNNVVARVIIVFRKRTVVRNIWDLLGVHFVCKKTVWGRENFRYKAL